MLSVFGRHMSKPMKRDRCSHPLETKDMIRAEDVSKKFGEVVAVDHVTLDIPRGTILGMIGPNGAGKTTLVRMMVGILRPTSGTCYIAEKPSYLLNSQERARMGYMTQQKALYPDLTARENLEFFTKSYGIDDSTRRNQLIAHASELTKITDSMDRPVEVLSGGTIQRLSLACAIAHDPDLIFLDEPTVGVSPDLRMEFWDYFHKLARDGKTIVMTTHYLDEASKCDAVAMIFQGRILAHGAPEEIISSLPLESTIAGIVDSNDSARLASVLGDVAPTDVKGRRFIVTASNDEVLLRTFERIITSGIAVSNIVVRQPTLEEAFTHLVRRRQQ
jgi:ABC-2 type transport system ATP-binding protein